MLTTLTAAVIAQMDQSSSQNLLYTGGYSNSSKFIVCVCNVGDSLAYVYSPKYGVREITHGNFIYQLALNYNRFASSAILSARYISESEKLMLN